METGIGSGIGAGIEIKMVIEIGIGNGIGTLCHWEWGFGALAAPNGDWDWKLGIRRLGLGDSQREQAQIESLRNASNCKGETVSNRTNKPRGHTHEQNHH